MPDRSCSGRAFLFLVGDPTLAPPTSLPARQVRISARSISDCGPRRSRISLRLNNRMSWAMTRQCAEPRVHGLDRRRQLPDLREDLTGGIKGTGGVVALMEIEANERHGCLPHRLR